MNESCENCNEYDKEKHSCPKFCRVIRETVDEIKPKWIPVTERLPDDMKRVLVYSKIQGIRTDFLCHYGSGWYRTTLVTHWMPLPEPPKEEDDA